MTKDQIRKDMKQLRNMLSQKERQDLSSAIEHTLLLTTAYLNCRRLFSYLSFQSEVDTYDLIHQALKDKKQVFLPRVENKKIEFYEIQDIADLELSSYGILEPSSCETRRYTLPFYTGTVVSEQKRFDSSAETVSGQIENLMLLPGLAFDSYGNRIGYGAGYYDRYLSEFPKEHFYKIAVAYDLQLTDQIPYEEFDVKTDEIITPTRRINCGLSLH